LKPRAAAPTPPPPRSTAPPFARPLLALLSLSGAVALAYQSLWMRQLSLILGSTTYAVGTVLAAFMAGLGAGAWLLGRRADRAPDPLRLYAMLEAAIGVTGLVSPLALGQGNRIYAVCYAHLHGTSWLTLVRALIGFGFVAVPALLMGGTLPVAGRYLVRRSEDVGRDVGLLYAANTLGAAAGALALPFLLLPALGMRATLLLCGVTNLAIAAMVWPATGAVAAPATPAPRTAPDTDLLPAFFLSGLVALALEVVWNRFFVVYIGSSIYSYALILCLYLLGVVAGGTAFAALARRGLDPRRVFAVSLFVLVADLALAVPLMDRIVYPQVAVLDAFGTSFAGFQAASALVIALVVLPPTVLFGVSFPAVVQAASRDVARLGADVGLVYLVNSVGTTAGALVASFVLIPGLGVRRSLDVLALVACLALVLAAGRRRPFVALAAAALALVPAVAPRWDARRMHTGLSKEPAPIVALWRQGDLTAGIEGIVVREVRDGLDATVSVADYDDQRALLVNGKTDATDGVDMANQLMLGHLPLLLHPAPRDVLVIGMGSGVTLSAVVRHPVTTIDLVEISADVLDLGDRQFRAVNRNALHDPRVTAWIEDGRNFVAFNELRTYDVIISEPSNPWMTGVANLFTDEFFAELRQRLRPDGVLAQWFHFYNMRLDDIRSLVATLERHFPHVYVFAFHHRQDLIGDLLLVAGGAPLDFSAPLAALGAAGPAAEDLRRFGFDAPGSLLAGFVFGDETVERFAAGALLNSDDRPRIELDAPRAIFRDTALDNLKALLEASDGARLPAGVAVHERLPDGARRTFAGYRVESGTPVPNGLPPRSMLGELGFEDAAGHRVVMLRASEVRDATGLARLAASAAGGPVTRTGETAVGGHQAVVYRPAGTGPAAVAWTCPESGASYAAATDAVEALQGFHCHPGG
jgi:spermidine synthase